MKKISAHDTTPAQGCSVGFEESVPVAPDSVGLVTAEGVFITPEACSGEKFPETETVTK